MSASGGEGSEVERLKALLFGVEEERLAAAETSLRGLSNFVGDAPRLEAATARVLVEAFRRAEIERHGELAAAVAPVVVAAIRSEIVNSRDVMVEALYPIAGRMVTAAVANAFRELIATINQRLDALVSSDQWRLRFRALATGRSMAEIALSEARGAACVRALLLERGGGRLLAQWRPGDAPADNPDLVSGLIAAVTEFAATVFSERRGELRALDLGASRIYVRASSRVILAAEMVGEVTPAQEKALDARFLSLVERRDRNELLGEADLAELASAKPRATGRGGKRRWIVLALIVAVALGLALRAPVYRWRKGAEIAEAYRAARAANPTLASYPIALSEDWGHGTMVLRGLAPSRDEADRLAGAVGAAASPLKIASALEIVAPESDLLAVRADTARLADAVAEQWKGLGALRAEIESLKAGSASLAGLGERVDALAAQNAAAAQSGKALAARLDAQVRGAAALGAKFAPLAAASAGLAEAVARAETERKTLSERLDQRSAALATLRGDFEIERADRDASAGALNSRIDNLKAQVARLVGAIAHEGEDRDAAVSQAKAAAAGASKDLAGTLEVARAQSEQALAAIRADLAAVADGARSQTVALGGLESRLKDRAADVDRKRAQTMAWLGEARTRLDALRAEYDEDKRGLPAVARRSAIFFTDRDVLENPETAGKTVDAIAEAIRRTGEGVRVIGYADDLGGTLVNYETSRLRAARIAKMLTDRGVFADKVITVGRGATTPISDGVSPRSRNRRVTFEPVYPGEIP